MGIYALPSCIGGLWMTDGNFSDILCAGFCGGCYTCVKHSACDAKQAGKPFIGDSHDRCIPQSPFYHAGFAVYITLDMKIDLNLPRGDRQRVFLDHLNSQLRSRTSGYSGSASYREDGLFESSVTGPFLVDQEQVPLTWRVVKSPDGSLLFIEAERADDTTCQTKWEHAAYEFVTSVLSAALAERRNRFFRRVFFNYVGVQLDGEYWLPGMRFAPAWPEDDQPYLINAERVVSIDMAIDAIDDMDAMSLAEETARRQAARISLLLDVGLYRTTSQSKWVIPITDDRPADKSVRLQLGFWGHGPQLTEMPKKGNICPLGKYSGSLTARYRVAGQLLSFPPQARKILRAIDDATPVVTDSFDRSARLHQVALVIGNQYPSVGLAYRVAAIEAISKADSECKGFSDFIRKYAKSMTNTDALLDYMYGTARSAHFHAGEFPLGEFGTQRFFDPLMDSDYVQQSHVHRMCFEIIREAIVNWIFDLLPDVPEENSDDST